MCLILLFWTDVENKLRIRHVDFLEIFPLPEQGICYHNIKDFQVLTKFLLEYKVPKYEIYLHKSLNEFIELISIEETTEIQITKYIENNPEILQYAFGVNELNPQVDLIWQFHSGKSNLKPDFMPVRMDGYCDIFEFKIPRLKNNSMVGIKERRHPSYEVDSAIAQLNCYSEWCSQVINTDWLEKEKGIRVFNPIKYLIIGHSNDFNSEERRKLREERNVIIFTYDEFIELVRFQIYRYK